MTVSSLEKNQQESVELETLPREERLAHLASSSGLTIEAALVRLASEHHLKVLNEFKVLDSPAKYIPSRMIHEYHCLPILSPDNRKQEDSGHEAIDLVTGWAPDARMTRWVMAVTGRRPRWYLGDPGMITRTIQQSFGVGSAGLEDEGLESLDDWDPSRDDDENQNAAVIRFINEIIEQALADRATDIHFEPSRDSLQIRFRVDGELAFVTVPENLVKIKGAIISRLKIMARLNISEKRRPQDGRINYQIGGNDIDIRISTFPTMYGESVSLRLLNQRQKPLSLSEIGLLDDDHERVAQVLARPHGIVLVTGPTGSGKSTTLNAFIRTINTPERRILTVEDPIEYEVEGVNQTQIKPEIGLDFATALRHILRQDPDVIMVGEIRDRETAEIAIRAALTGHMVLSTIHTNDAAGAVTRLVDMDIEPFLIASAVEQVIAQRLIRRLDGSKSQKAKLSEEYLETCLRALGIDRSEVRHIDLLREPITGGLSGYGYYGRLAIFEVMTVNDAIHELIVKRAPAKDIRQLAIEQGMRTLQQCGWEQVKHGQTSLSEIMRYAELGSEQ
mgnify:FL=1